jgi:hypothetical protein
MKFSSTILALALVHSATAFLAPQRPNTFNHALASTQDSVNVGERVSAPNAQGTDTGLKTAHGPGSKGNDRSARPVTVQGGSLRTWSFTTPAVERVQVILKTEGRPLNSDIDLWQGPDNTPQKMAVYIEDGALRPFNSVIETPRGQNAIAIRNTASMEYPLTAMVEAGISDSYGGADKLADAGNGRVIQGGAIKTYSFGSPVGSVQILMKTDGRPLNARIELLQGPNNNKQVVDLYTEDGLERPFYAVIETPGSGNVVRIINTATMEYPLTASVEPFSVEPGFDDSAAEGAWDQTNDASFFFLGGR